MSRRVLVVDDNRELAENIAELIEEEGYVADVFFRPEDAIAHAQRETYDVAILDVRLPAMDGVTLFKELSDLHPDATYVLMTAFTTDERIADALASGVRAVLPKPVPIGDLMNILPPPEAGADQVLLVEDDHELASSLGETLRERGYRVSACHTLAEARASLSHAAVPIGAVVDVRLPDGDGSELAHTLCERQVPVVLITGYEPTEAVATVREACAHHCRVLTKPFSPAALFEALQDVFSAHPPAP
ncbi:MAG: response regulator [Myxococcota bacterium]